MSTTARAAQAATQVTETIRYKERTVRAAPRLGDAAGKMLDEAVDIVLAGEARSYMTDTMDAIPDDARWEIALLSQDVATRRLWQRHRVAYAIDPGLWDELGHTGPGDQLPPDIFTRLPHPDPFLAFPEPIVLPMRQAGERQRILGCFVTGRQPLPGHDQVPCSSAHPDATAISLLFAGVVETDDGTPKMAGAGVVDMLYTRTSIVPADGDTLGDLIDAAVARFHGLPASKWGMGDPDHDLRVMLTRAIGALLYLCATNAELRPLPAGGGRKKKKGAGKTTKPPRVVEVGYKIGPALREHRRAARSAPGAGTGKRRRPHVRRAHPHIYRVGPGRRGYELKWLFPIAVNATGRDAQHTTIVPVPHKEAS